MIKITILYPNKKDGWFDMDYYLNKHMPMSIKKFGDALKGVTVEAGLNAGIPNSNPPYIIICSLFFESIESFEEAFTPILPDLTADMPNYTDIDIIFQMSEVKLMHKAS